MKLKMLILLVSVMMGNCAMMAQGYYDDDIYFDASKSKIEKKNKENKRLEYDGSDVYVVNGTMDVDVDAYNRRNLSNVVDSSAIDTLASRDYLYTRRIERFYDPGVVKNSGDSALIASYYNSTLEDDDIDVNIYLGGSPYWTPYNLYSYNWYGYPYWSSAVYWDYYWYGPSWVYNPYWSWYSWWGPSWYPGPGYYPPHPHHPPHYGHNPAINRRPASPGAYRPVRPGYNGHRNGMRNNYRPSGYNDYRPSDKNNKPSVDGRRPGANKRSDYNANRNYNNSYDRNKSSYNPSRSGGRSSGFTGGSRGGGGTRGGRGGRH